MIMNLINSATDPRPEHRLCIIEQTRSENARREDLLFGALAELYSSLGEGDSHHPEARASESFTCGGGADYGVDLLPAPALPPPLESRSSASPLSVEISLTGDDSQQTHSARLMQRG